MHLAWRAGLFVSRADTDGCSAEFAMHACMLTSGVSLVYKAEKAFVVIYWVIEQFMAPKGLFCSLVPMKLLENNIVNVFEVLIRINFRRPAGFFY